MFHQKQKISLIEKLATQYGLEESQVEGVFEMMPEMEGMLKRKLTFEEAYDLQSDVPLPTPSAESD